jgi:hypothetical protein
MATQRIDTLSSYEIEKKRDDLDKFRSPNVDDSFLRVISFLLALTTSVLALLYGLVGIFSEWFIPISVCLWILHVVAMVRPYLRLRENRAWLKDIGLDHHYQQCMLWLRRYKRLTALIKSGDITGDEAIALRDAAEEHIRHHLAPIEAAWVALEVKELDLPKHIVVEPDPLPDLDKMAFAEFDRRLNDSRLHTEVSVKQADRVQVTY